MTTQCRNACFTIFEAPLEWYQTWKEKEALPEEMQFMIYQLEVSPTTDQVHVQGYVQFTKKMGLRKIKELLARNSAHIEAAKGSQEDNIRYCSKEETRYRGEHYNSTIQKGFPKEQGRRTDLESIAQAVVEGGVRVADIALQNPVAYIRNYRGLQQLETMVLRKFNRGRPKIYYIHGKPGTGKSLWARNKWPEAYHASDMKEGWFDAYTGEDTIIFDDFAGNYPLRDMLRLCDFGPLKLPVKGSWVPIKGRRIVFTSNYPPDEVYTGHTGQGNAAFLRRIRDFGKVLDADEDPDGRFKAAVEKAKEDAETEEDSHGIPDDD